MSRAIGKVRFIKDNMIAWFIYNGTSDTAYPILFEDFDSFIETAWYNREGYDCYDDENIPHECTCSEDEEIEIYESYGGGMLWKGRACRKCMIITQNLSSDDYVDTLSSEDFKKWLEEDGRGNFPEWCEKEDFKFN